MTNHISNYVRYRHQLNHLAIYDLNAIIENWMQPTDRTLLDTAIIGLRGPKGSFKATTNYLQSLNK